jgi:hypothetical protein
MRSPRREYTARAVLPAVYSRQFENMDVFRFRVPSEGRHLKSGVVSMERDPLTGEHTPVHCTIGHGPHLRLMDGAGFYIDLQEV